MSDNETDRREADAERKLAWRAEPKSAIPTAIARCIMGLAALAVGILGVQTIGAVSKYPEAVPDFIVNTAMVVMFTLLFLAAGMAVALFAMSRAVLIRNTPQAMADDYWTKRVEEKLRISEEQKGQLVADNEEMRKEKSITDSENASLRQSHDVLTAQLEASQEDSQKLKKENSDLNVKVNELTQQFEEMKKKKSIVDTEYASMRQMRDIVSVQLQASLDEKNTLAGEISDLHMEKEEEAKKTEKMSIEKSKTDSENASLKSKQDELITQLKASQAENQKLKKEISELNVKLEKFVQKT